MSNKLQSFYGIPLIPLPPEVSRILFISNLDSSMTGAMLYKVFGSIGPIRQIRIGDNSPGSETANTAFVIYEDVFHAKTAQEKFNGFTAPTKASKNPKAQNNINRPLQVRFYNQKMHLAAFEKKKKRMEQTEELRRRQREITAASANIGGGLLESVVPPNDAAAVGYTNSPQVNVGFGGDGSYDAI